MIDLNSTTLKRESVAAAIVEQIDAGIARLHRTDEPRDYLGTSYIGKSCLRAIQYEYVQAPKDFDFEPKTYRVFDRGHWGEAKMADWLRAAGFDLKTLNARGEQIGFACADGRFRGHCDGVITGWKGPGECLISTPALWENKVLGAKGWKSIVSKGVAVAYPHYAAQIAVYQAYLDLTEHPAMFTALNADTAEIVVEMVPYNGALAQQMVDRAAQIISATEAGEQQPRVTADPDWFECKFCPWRTRCWAA